MIIMSQIRQFKVLSGSIFLGGIMDLLKDNLRKKKVKKMALLTIVIMGAIFSMSGILFPTGVCSIFMNINDDMRAIAIRGLRTYFIAFLPMGVNLLASYYLQSVLSVKKSLCISLLRNVVLSSVAIIVFPILFDGNSLWVVMPVVEIVVLVVSVVFLRQSNKM